MEGGFGVAKPYKGGAYCFVGLLPDEGMDIYDFAASLDGELKDSLNAHGDTDLSKLKETIKALETENRQLYEEEVKLHTRFDQLCNELETHNARFDEVAAVKAELDFDFNQEKEAAEKKKQDISVNP